MKTDDEREASLPDPMDEYTLLVRITQKMNGELQQFVNSGHYGQDTSEAAERIIAQFLERWRLERREE